MFIKDFLVSGSPFFMPMAHWWRTYQQQKTTKAHFFPWWLLGLFLSLAERYSARKHFNTCICTDHPDRPVSAILRR
jgi:hypothetical protein